MIFSKGAPAKNNILKGFGTGFSKATANLQMGDASNIPSFELCI